MSPAIRNLVELEGKLIRGSGFYEARKSMKWSSRLREMLFPVPPLFFCLTFREFRSRMKFFARSRNNVHVYSSNSSRKFTENTKPESNHLPR